MTGKTTEPLGIEALPQAPDPTALLPQPGAIFDGKYRIERTLGLGAMALVLEATHLQLEDRVAIKLLLPQWAARPELVERFMREGRAATRIRSEHVVRVFDVGVALGQPYLVMEYLDGSDLDQVLAKDGPLPVGLAIDYLLQACEAIAEAHVRGIVHRDLKPANLFLIRRADGSACVKVLDFGISKAAPGAVPDPRTTEPAAVMGSPHYMSPEQMLSSTDVDARSDLWALGAILHELLVGAPAFDGETIAALSASVLRDAPPRLAALRADVPPAVEAVVLRCLEKDPDRRFANVAELAGALAGSGSASARASAERIARVLEPGSEKLSMPIATAAPPRVERAASLVETARPRRRVLGYVVAAIAFVGLVSTVSGMAVRNARRAAIAETERHDAVTAAPGVPAPPAPSSTPAIATTAEAKRDVPSPAPVPHSSAHARGPRRSPSTQRRPPPLPDFPVPSADPAGEPPVLPVATPSPAPTAAPAPTASTPAAQKSEAEPAPMPPLP